MELKQNFNSDNTNPYDSDRPMHNQNNYDQPYHNPQINNPIVNQPTYQNNTYELSSPNNYYDPTAQQYVIKQEVILQPERPSCLAHLCDGSLEGNARNNFIKKVYMILSIQLLLTVGMCFISFYSHNFLRFQIQHYWLMYVCLGLMIAVEIPIFCCQVGRVFPTNMILLLIFTLTEAYVVSCITSIVANVEGGAIVVVAASMTLAIVIALTLYAMFTRSDFTTGWGILFAFIAPFIMFGIFAWIAWIPVLHSLYCALGAAIFGIYLVIDTQLIVGGGRYELSMDDYVAGALMLYIDIIQIFLYILSLLGNN